MLLTFLYNAKYYQDKLAASAATEAALSSARSKQHKYKKYDLFHSLSNLLELFSIKWLRLTINDLYYKIYI